MFSKNKERLRFNLVEHKKSKMHVPFELSMEMGTMIVGKKEEKPVMNWIDNHWSWSQQVTMQGESGDLNMHVQNIIIC